MRIIVVGVGLSWCGRHRRLTVEDILAGVGLLIWLVADIGIEHFIAETAIRTALAGRGAVAGRCLRPAT